MINIKQGCYSVQKQKDGREIHALILHLVIPYSWMGTDKLLIVLESWLRTILGRITVMSSEFRFNDNKSQTITGMYKRGGMYIRPVIKSSGVSMIFYSQNKNDIPDVLGRMKKANIILAHDDEQRCDVGIVKVLQ